MGKPTLLTDGFEVNKRKGFINIKFQNGSEIDVYKDKIATTIYAPWEIQQGSEIPIYTMNYELELALLLQKRLIEESK